MKTELLAALLLFSCLSQTISAKEFVNMDFDLGRLPTEPVDQLHQPVDEILPGWTARMGSHVLTEIGYDAQLAHTGYISITPQGARPTLVEGRYGLLLQGGAEFPSLSPVVPASISQVGLIPAGTKSLLFRADLLAGSRTEVRLNGEVSPFYSVEKVPRTTLFGVDVRAFAGQEVELSFVNYALPTEPGVFYFDSLSFSSSVTVPEPATWALLGTGSIALVWATRRRTPPSAR